MLHAAVDHEAIPCVNFEDMTANVEAKSALYDVHQLVMRVRVPRANPVGFEEVTHEHQLLVVREHLANHARLGRLTDGVGGVDDAVWIPDQDVSPSKVRVRPDYATRWTSRNARLEEPFPHRETTVCTRGYTAPVKHHSLSSAASG